MLKSQSRRITCHSAWCGVGLQLSRSSTRWLSSARKFEQPRGRCLHVDGPAFPACVHVDKYPRWLQILAFPASRSWPESQLGLGEPVPPPRVPQPVCLLSGSPPRTRQSISQAAPHSSFANNTYVAHVPRETRRACAPHPPGPGPE